MSDPAQESWSATAADVARHLGVTAAYVYSHAVELGARRLPGAGPKPRLRFCLAEVDRRLVAPEEVINARPVRLRAQPNRGPSAAVELLPIRGRVVVTAETSRRTERRTANH